ncbi:MAG: hypothetical protein ACK5MH_01400 [Bacteroidales bacterium]|jgi:hypothetical protein|nr:hypothetical protein [Bacteroidales bacterium]MDY0053832.1 hypothetical protein [Bacteroidales bacterium]
MNKLFISILFFVISFHTNNTYSQSIEQSCKIIESEIKDNIYREFGVNSNGYLTYKYIDEKGSNTTLTIDLTKVNIMREISSRGYRVYIRCIDGISCINEKGRVGDDETFYADFPKTYLPSEDEKGMNIIYNQLLFLLKFGNTNR